jgi:aminoglycoside phosphotransferase (APT) family kinase protein
VRDDAPVRHAALPAVAQKLHRLDAVREVSAWAERLEAYSPPADIKTSIHGDVHRFNVFSGPGGELLALLDWGDAGWGDPAYDLARAPLEALAPMLAAYEAASRRGLGPDVRGRILRYRLGRLLRWARGPSEALGDLAAFLTFARHLPDDWRPYGLG